MAVVAVSEKPWSDYTKADYTPEQWHAACLIHQHEGAPTSKDQCKLPVKTPAGTLNRNGVHAAAAALAGARGGVNASAEEKAAAAKDLVRCYGQMGDTPPPSIKHDGLKSFLAHHGVKGMKWGVRRKSSGTDSVGSTSKTKGTPKATEDTASTGKSSSDRSAAERFVKDHMKDPHSMTDEELRVAVTRARMIDDYNRFLAPNPDREMRDRVGKLSLQKQYSQLQKELHPSSRQKAMAFVASAGAAYAAYAKLDKASSGALSKSIAGVFTTSQGKHRK